MQRRRRTPLACPCRGRRVAKGEAAQGALSEEEGVRSWGQVASHHRGVGMKRTAAAPAHLSQTSGKQMRMQGWLCGAVMAGGLLRWVLCMLCLMSSAFDEQLPARPCGRARLQASAVPICLPSLRRLMGDGGDACTRMLPAKSLHSAWACKERADCVCVCCGCF